MRLIALGFAAVALASAAHAQNWSGAYGGLALSYDDFTVNDLSFGPGEFTADGAGFQGFVGYNWQSGNIVYGGEVSLGISNASGDDGAFQRPWEAQTYGEIRGRIGAATGQALPYLALGWAAAKVEADHDGGGVNFADETISGPAVAVGLDYMVGSSSFVRFEYQHIEYDDYQLPFFGGTDNHDMTTSANRILIGYGMQF